MPLKDWEQTILGEPFTLPIRGKQYPIPELGWYSAIKLRENSERIADMLRLIQDEQRAARGEERFLDEAERKRIEADPPTLSDEAYLQLLLGSQLAVMREDDVPPSAILHAARCAHTWFVEGRDAAEKLWNEGPDPKAQEAERVALASLTTSPATPPPAPTSSTKSPASTASTSSPKKAKSASTKSSTRRRSS